MMLRDFFLFFIAKNLKMKLMFVLSSVVYVTLLLVADSVTRASNVIDLESTKFSESMENSFVNKLVENERT